MSPTKMPTWDVEGSLECGVETIGSTINATNLVDMPFHVPNETGDLSYRFYAESTGQYVFDTCGSAYNTFIHIFDDSGHNATSAPGATVVQCDACGISCTSRARAVVPLEGGQWYFVVIDGNAEEGCFRVFVECPGGVADDHEVYNDQYFHR